MTVLKYKPEDYSTLCKWLELRNMEPWDMAYIPKRGYVIFSWHKPIAMCFLRMVEGNSAMLDGLCTDPEAEPMQRNAAIDLLVQYLIEEAKEEDLRGIISFSKDVNTLERAVRIGFEKRPEQTMIALKLKG